MKEYKAAEVAKLLGIKPATFSTFIKNNKNELADLVGTHIRSESKFTYYDMVAVQRIFQVRNQPLPAEIVAEMNKKKTQEAYDQIKKKYNIVTFDDALQVIIKLQNTLYKYRHENEALKDIAELKTNDAEDMQKLLQYRTDELILIMGRATDILEKVYPNIKQKLAAINPPEPEFDPSVFDTINIEE